MNLPKIHKIKEDLKFLKECEVIVYGSLIEGGFRESSDIDIGLITRKIDRAFNSEAQLEYLGKTNPIYEIRAFELLPIYIQISIINNYAVIFGDPLEISEYFYEFRKKWDDCKYRILENQFKHFKEKIYLMKKSKSSI